jgi:hypothetical protein
MKKTKLAELDEVFDDAQGLLDEIYAIKDPIEETRDNFMSLTELDRVTCGNTHHATMGTLFAFFASSKSAKDAVSAVKIVPAAPFIEINGDSAAGNLALCILAFTDYVQALIEANTRILPLVEKVTAIALKAPDLPDKAKQGVQSAKDLGVMDK